MKKCKNIGTVGLILIAVLFTANTLKAQRSDSIRNDHGKHKSFDARRNFGMLGIPNLTEDQKTKIKAQQVSFGKEALPLTNQLAEKRAHLRTLQTAATFDSNAVNATIDDISKTESQLKKKRAANHEAIRKLLTDEQRLAFDSHKSFARGNRGGHDRHFKGHRN